MRSFMLVGILALCLVLLGCIGGGSPGGQLVGNDTDEHGCITSAGYSWCEESASCIRAWEENCTAHLVGNDSDEHGCIASAGYSWCEEKQACIRIWEENCSAGLVGNDSDEHGCIGSAGYTWCAGKSKCLRVWEEDCPSLDLETRARLYCGRAEIGAVYACGNYFRVVSEVPGAGSTIYLENGSTITCPLVAPEEMGAECRQYVLGSNCAERDACIDEELFGGDRDGHGCIASAGYSWCEEKQACIRPWEEDCSIGLPGSDRDEHGCIGSAGYSWCERKGKCLRAWEEPCLRVLTENYPPYNYNGTGGLTGQSTEIVREIMSRINQNITVEEKQWEAGYALALQGPDVALYSVTRTPSREGLFKWVGPISEPVRDQLFVKTSYSTNVTSLADAKTASSICVYRDDSREQALVRAGFTNLYYGEDDDDCLARLANGSVEMWAGTNYSLTAYMGAHGQSAAGYRSAWVLEEYPLYIAFSRDVSGSVIAAWQQALDGMKADGTYNATLARYGAGG